MIQGGVGSREGLITTGQGMNKSRNQLRPVIQSTEYYFPKPIISVGDSPGNSPHAIDVSYPCDGEQIKCHSVGQE